MESLGLQCLLPHFLETILSLFFDVILLISLEFEILPISFWNVLLNNVEPCSFDVDLLLFFLGSFSSLLDPIPLVLDLFESLIVLRSIC